MIIILKTKWLSSMRTVAPKLDNNHPEKIKKFSEYISAYYDEYEGADAKTKNAIMEEVFVDHVSHIIDGLIKMHHKDIDIDKVMEDSPHKMVLEIQNKVNGKRLEEEDFKDFGMI